MKIQETYTSYQGTGLLTGVKQDFVRFAGCGVACPLRANCDQPEALPFVGNEMSIESVISGMQTDWLHITGGEPAEHSELVLLVDAALAAGKKVQVQTSGTIPIAWNHRPFVTVSPKSRKVQVEADEIVLVATKWMTEQFALAVVSVNSIVFVIPEAIDGVFDTERMLWLLDVLHHNGVDARAGLQSHLLWGVN